eukprot:NODE_582_length_6440_cov_0.149661.p1 type:complete len:321 gc:universal NODE_582_length_6440_cov_0.149661:3218-4180(+)
MSDYDNQSKKKPIIGKLLYVVKSKLELSHNEKFKELGDKLKVSPQLLGFPEGDSETRTEVEDSNNTSATESNSNNDIGSSNGSNGSPNSSDWNSTAATNNNGTAPAGETSLFKLMDSDPTTDQMDVTFIPGNCFAISSDYVAPFNGQLMQPFKIQDLNIDSSDALNSLFSNFKSNSSDCDKYAYLELTSRALISSKECTGKPMCKQDCEQMNIDMELCGFPSQLCEDASNCVPINSTSNIAYLGVLAWWVVLLIVLALLLLIGLVVCCVCKKRKESRYIQSTDSIDSDNPNVRNIAQEEGDNDAPVAVQDDLESNRSSKI